MGFERARRPEHKAIRRAQILDATHELIAEQGVRGLTLATIGERVGLAASTVARQFHSRDDLFVTLTEREWGRFDELVRRGLGERPEDIAGAFVRALVGLPVLCELGAYMPAAQQFELADEVVRSYRRTTLAHVRGLAEAVHAADRRISVERGRGLVATAVVMAAGTWTSSNPGRARDPFHANSPDLDDEPFDFEVLLRSVLEAVVAGFRQRPPAESGATAG
ncbi:TetR family transcriptional regulator [Jiangella mangrovi]|uniref:AcrR family transcriptional regulator n=1 Tax=Jiangella mangrovi TaxID=1524084 RepID=A0A7W9LMB9_9ACTN|nr:TetR family transcriptional regulator [Jiangella mangrovi]MBB5789103.1 AcrR family transcriptional regulator [Jiangella mangrovi]